MEVYDVWKKLNQDRFSQTPMTEEDIMNAIRHESRSTVTELKKRLRYKIYWIILFMCIAILWLAFNIEKQELVLIQGVFLAQGFIYLIPIGSYYVKMDQDVKFSRDALSFSRANALLITKALRIELVIALCTSPWPIVGGLLLSNYYFGHSIVEAFHNPLLIGIGLIGLVISIPFTYFAGKKANEIAYGKYIIQLHENILKMESL